MGAWGYVILVAGAIVLGMLGQALRGRVGYEGILTAIGAGLGGFVASEYHLFGLGQWGYTYDGLAVFPALIGAIIVAVVVEAVIYFAERPTATA
ncbi:MAG TPA: hypothetical protein VMU89_07725 [Thermomicrobiaceae bacterium]|nr:hypothetical protein [Thermomicrobiaceae bacterium]